MFIDDCMWQFYECVCEALISIYNRWELEEFKTTCKLVFNRFWKQSLKPNQKNVTFEGKS